MDNVKTGTFRFKLVDNPIENTFDIIEREEIESANLFIDELKESCVLTDEVIYCASEGVSFGNWEFNGMITRKVMEDDGTMTIDVEISDSSFKENINECNYIFIC